MPILTAMGQRLLYETHMHTPLCRHADGEPEAYAATAQRRGLAGMIVTCHNAMPESYGHSGRMGQTEVDAYLAMVNRCASEFRGRLDVRVGLECDYFPGYEDYVRGQIDSLPLHYVIGSVHPHLAIWRRRFVADDPRRTQAHYFEQLAAAAETGMFDCISHPDLIKNMTEDDWDFGAIADHVGHCLDRIAATGVAMELNTSGRLKSIPEMNPTPPLLELMRERDIAVVIGADAHVPQRVGDHFEEALGLLRDVGYTHVSQFLDRRRHDVPIEAAIGSLIGDDSPVGR